MGLYLLCTLPALLGLMLALAAARDVPTLARVALPLLLFFCTALLLLALAAAVLLTAANDGCTNLEAQILARVGGASGGSDDPQRRRVLAIGQYYLYGQGGPLRALLRREFEVDLDALTAQALALRDDALQVG